MFRRLYRFLFGWKDRTVDWAEVDRAEAGEWWKLMSQWRARAERAERLLTDKLTLREIGRAHHLADLEEKNRRLKMVIRQMQVVAERHNREVYATGLIVHCTGCLAGAPANYKALTEERVKEVEHLACRLTDWWRNNKHRIKAAETAEGEK